MGTLDPEKSLTGLSSWLSTMVKQTPGLARQFGACRTAEPTTYLSSVVPCDRMTPFTATYGVFGGEVLDVVWLGGRSRRVGETRDAMG